MTDKEECLSRTDLLVLLRKGLSQPNVLAFCFRPDEKGMHMFSGDSAIAELHHFMKLWRPLSKQGFLRIRIENNQEVEFDEKKYYSFTMQKGPLLPETDDSYGISDPIDLMVFGRLITGITYFFHSEANRNKILKYLMKGCPVDEQPEKEKHAATAT